MRYESEPLQDRLAAEFVLGNLRGAARSRLVTLMRSHPGLRAKVARWEERLFPLVMRAPTVKAPPRVWRAIHAHISPHAASRLNASGWFRRLAMGGIAAVALAALVYIAVAPSRRRAVAPPREPAFTMVAVLNDARAQPGILVSRGRHDKRRSASSPSGSWHIRRCRRAPHGRPGSCPGRVQRRSPWGSSRPTRPRCSRSPLRRRTRCKGPSRSASASRRRAAPSPGDRVGLSCSRVQC